MSKFRMDKSVPLELRDSAQKLFEKYEPLLPPTLNRVDILFMVEDDDGETSDACATAEIEREYRRATITLHPYFLKQDAEGRRDDVRHEIAHLITDHATAAFTDLFEVLMEKHKGSPFFEYASEQIRRANEAMTEDLANSWKVLEQSL